MIVPDAPTWAILIPTVASREATFLRLLNVLLPQLDPYVGRVKVIAWRNGGSPTLGEIRDRLVSDAGTDYVSFIDDDDLVSEDYVSEIVAGLSGRPDHVGFLLDYHVAGAYRETVQHTIAGPRRWCRFRGVLHRDLTHVDPIRRELALRGSFVVRRGRPEDRAWVRTVRSHVRTEHFIPRSMYRYLYDPAGSVWNRLPSSTTGPGRHPEVDHPAFAWHPLSGS